MSAEPVVEPVIEPVVEPVKPAEPNKNDDVIKQYQQKAQKAMEELDALKKRTDFTQAQRTELEERMESIQKELLTKEQLFEQEVKKKESSYTQQVETLSSERDNWKDRFTDSTITRAITDASAKNEAFDSDTIVALLKPNTKLIEALDDSKAPTGEYEVKVDFLDPEGKGGKPVKLTLSVPDAVKRMTELEKYQYLFKGKGASGAGRNNSGTGKPLDPSELAKDPAAYREARKNGNISF